jgi:N-acetylneuraminic acid mutarotase
MTLLTKWIPLLIPVLIFTACSSKSDSSSDLVGNWVTRYSFNGEARSEAVGFTIGNKYYFGTGYNGVNRLNDFWEYNATTGLWRQVKTFPGNARSSAVGFSIGANGYVGTGYNDNGDRLKDFYEYIPGTLPTDSGTWVQKNDFAGIARQDATAFALGTKGYILTGYNNTYLKDFWEYDPTGDTWTEKPFPGNKRREAVSFVIGTKAYLATGINNGLLVNDFWSYDQTAGWTKLREINNVNADESYDDEYTSIMRSNSTAFVVNNKGYISTGESGANLSDTWEYDPTTDLWVKKTAFEGAPRTGATGFSVGAKGFIVTGRNGSSPYDDFWEFLPDATVVAND